MDLTIRHYNPSDQLAVFEISADTAFFGEPVEVFLDDRKLYCDAFARYYTDHEAPFVWVAEDALGIIGFLLGCAESSEQSKQWKRYIITKVLVHWLMGQYRLGRRTTTFAWGMLVGVIRGEEPKVDLNDYPAHLQIDVKQGYRGEGVGRRLIETYLELLNQLEVRGVHLHTTSHNEAACHLYQKIGFRLLDSRTSYFWTRMLGYDVENRSYGLRLA